MKKQKWMVPTAAAVGVVAVGGGLFYGGMRLGYSQGNKDGLASAASSRTGGFAQNGYPGSGGGGYGGGGAYGSGGSGTSGGASQSLREQLRNATTPEERQQILQQLQAQRAGGAASPTASPSPTADTSVE